MSHRDPLALADRLYRALLIFYPRSFRERYGPQVAQASGDCCREARRERGRSGLVLLWVSALSDIAISATGEHLSEVVRMVRPLVIRIAAWAAMVGGAMYLTSSLTHPSGLPRAASRT
jgi:hypothetical protein